MGVWSVTSVCGSLQLWLASYGYSDPTVLLPCCSFLWESHCFPKYLTYTEMLLWLDNFWASSPGCINIVGMAKQSMWICFTATFIVAQTSWLSWLYWHFRDALIAVLILRELSGLETIINGNIMHCASMKLPVWVRLAVPHLVSLLKSCMVVLNCFLTLVPRNEVIKSVYVNQHLFAKTLGVFLYALAYL